MTSKAIKLLERMKKSHSGWKRSDLDNLYTGFGFVIRHGSNHDIVSHPDYPQLRDTLQRHGKVPKYNIRKAIKLIDKLLEFQDTDNLDAESENNDESNDDE